MIIDIDSNPIINEHQAIVEYYNQFDFFENPREYVFFHVSYLEDGMGGCSGDEEPICEYYSYEYLEEQDREMREAEEQRQLEEQKRQEEIEYVDNMPDAVKREYYGGTENYLNLNDRQFEYLETVYYPIYEEEERQEQERIEQIRQELRQLEEQKDYEKVYEVHEVTNDKGFTYWVNDDGDFCYEDGRLVPPTDMAHLGAGLGTYPGYVLQ